VPECLIRRQARRENLERYLPVEPLILSSEYNRHSAAANLLLQPVSGDLRTGRETDQEPYGSVSLIAHRASRTRKPSSSLLYRRAQRERRVRTDIPGQKEQKEYEPTKPVTAHPSQSPTRIQAYITLAAGPAPKLARLRQTVPVSIRGSSSMIIRCQRIPR
jgi:hypothetical protein